MASVPPSSSAPDPPPITVAYLVPPYLHRGQIPNPFADINSSSMASVSLPPSSPDPLLSAFAISRSTILHRRKLIFPGFGAPYLHPRQIHRSQPPQFLDL
ncbi:hypothetical protein PVAP13_5NG431340 [Panicum virgatum]|uniref:Uncharacterized protein n=1 Tax=Panicum virgatum TaxID=38727 RepID=A0A8T0S2F9_PANVG|nr:hypothetical protein PVAP13_5NG431340 [Panicum virgatum]